MTRDWQARNPFRMAREAVTLDERARRFLFRRRIGEGAFGVVWEAYDTERGTRIALKALTRTEPGSLYLFKREFRARWPTSSTRTSSPCTSS